MVTKPEQKKPVPKKIQAFPNPFLNCYSLKKQGLSREIVTYFKFRVTSLSRYGDVKVTVCSFSH